MPELPEARFDRYVREGLSPQDAGVLSAIADMYTRWGKEDLAIKQYERLKVMHGSALPGSGDGGV